MTSSSSWTFLTNHAIVLVLIARDPDRTLHEIADRTGITERAVHRIVSDLVSEGYLVVSKVGRRNHYEVQRGAFLRHHAAQHVRVSDLIDVLQPPDPAT